MSSRALSALQGRTVTSLEPRKLRELQVYPPLAWPGLVVRIDSGAPIDNTPQAQHPLPRGGLAVVVRAHKCSRRSINVILAQPRCRHEELSLIPIGQPDAITKKIWRKKEDSR
jgi:hypothetical protein